MKKRLITVVALISMLIVSVFSAGKINKVYATESGGVATVSLSIDKLTVRKGETFIVRFSVDNKTNYDISTLMFVINYNNSDIEFCNASGVDSRYPLIQNSGGALRIKFNAFNASQSFRSGTNSASELALIMKYVGSNHTTDTESQFNVSDVTALSEVGYTYTQTSENYTLQSSEIASKGASITLTGLSNVNTLSNIQLTANGKKLELEPAFSPDVTEYTTYVEYSSAKIKATFTRTDTIGSKVTENNFNQKTNTGSNKFYIIVTAENGDQKIYNIDMHIVPSGMSISEYKEFIASQQTQPAETEPTQPVDEPVFSDADVSVTDVEIDDEPVLEPIIESATDVPEENVDKSLGDSIVDFFKNMNPIVLFACIGGLVLLVAGGFTAGYVAHKKAEREKMLMGMGEYYDEYYDDEYNGYDGFDGSYNDYGTYDQYGNGYYDDGTYFDDQY